MKQKQFSSNSEKRLILPNKISFKQTIKKIEFNSSKQEYDRKRQISIKNKLRELWLERIKIIPPHLTIAQREKFFRATDSFTQKDSDYFKMFRHNCFKKDLQDDDVELLFQKRSLQIETPLNENSRENSLGRRSYNPAMDSPQNRLQSLRSRKFKENWKLINRRDEMNILRFSIASPKQSNNNKIFENTQLLIQQEMPIEKQQKMGEFMYKKMVQDVEEQNKQNLQNETNIIKEERKFRLKPKKSKTSLIIKKPNISCDLS